MLAKADVRGVVLDELIELLEEDLEEEEVPELTGEEALTELQLNSLALARLLVRLEAAIGADPFAEGDLSIVDVHRIVDLVAAYEDAVTSAAA
jgi:acyl carrier protein